VKRLGFREGSGARVRPRGLGFGVWGLGFGGWVLGVGFWGLSFGLGGFAEEGLDLRGEGKPSKFGV